MNWNQKLALPPAERAGEARQHSSFVMSVACLPLLILLFSSVPWEGDPRTGPIATRLFELKASTWSWDQKEYRALLDSIDPNQKVAGVPLFVKLAIETNDEELLSKMIARGADINSTDWGCSPLLAALEAGEKKTGGSGTSMEQRLVKLLLRAGADPKRSPDKESVNRRIATGLSKTTCETLVDQLKDGRSILSVAVEKLHDDEVLQLMLDAGAIPRSKSEALGILARLKYEGGPAATRLRELCMKAGASIDDAFEGAALVDAIGTRYSSGAEKITVVAALLKKGADPNAKRRYNDKLPLEAAIDLCTRVQEVWGGNYETDSPWLRDYHAKEWREKNTAARKLNVEVRDLIRLLLESGADPNRRKTADGDGSSILSQAVRSCPSDVPELLVAHKAQVDKASVDAARFDLKRYLQGHFSGRSVEAEEEPGSQASVRQEVIRPTSPAVTASAQPRYQTPYDDDALELTNISYGSKCGSADSIELIYRNASREHVDRYIVFTKPDGSKDCHHTGYLRPGSVDSIYRCHVRGRPEVFKPIPVYGKPDIAPAGCD